MTPRSVASRPYGPGPGFHDPGRGRLGRGRSWRRRHGRAWGGGRGRAIRSGFRAVAWAARARPARPPSRRCRRSARRWTKACRPTRRPSWRAAQSPRPRRGSHPRTAARPGQDLEPGRRHAECRRSGGAAAKKAFAGAIEEGAQEAAEGMASQQGIAEATGADVNTQQDSFGNFVLGALSGGVMGAGAGLLGPGQTDSEQSGDAAGDARSATAILAGLMFRCCLRPRMAGRSSASPRPARARQLRP